MTDPNEEMPTDEDVERMAQVVHAGYLADHEADGGDPDHPAAVPWEDLPPELKAQNRDQARDIVARLREHGFRVAPIDALREVRIDGFDEATVEALGRDEHDRWARQKRLQGYEYGPTRVDEGEVLTHPDLVDWDDLDEDVREKDRRPMRRVVGTLAAGGWGLAPGPAS